MATSVLSSSQNSNTTGTAVSVSAPPGATAGNLMLCFVHFNQQTTIVDNNGATPFIAADISDYKPNTVSGHTVSLFTRRLVAGDPSTYNFTGGVSERWSIIALCIQSPHAIDYYDVAPTTTNASNLDSPPGSSDVVCDSITTLSAKAIHVLAGFIDASIDDFTGWPAGYTVAQSVDNNQGQSVVYKVIASPSVTGTQTFTHNGTGTAYIGLSFSIKDNGGSGFIINKLRPRAFAPGIAR